jgi:hypothetical protein
MPSGAPTPTTHAAERYAVLRELIAARALDSAWAEDVGGELADAVFASMPELAADEELRAGTHASAESAARLVVSMVVEGRDPASAVSPPAMVHYARDFVRRGAPIDTLMRAYHLAHARFFEVWVRDVRASVQDPKQAGIAIEEGASWTFAFVDAIGRDVAGRYAEERERWVRSAAAVRTSEVRALLAGTQTDASLASARLGYELARRHLALVVWSDAAQGETGADLAALERRAADAAARLGGRSTLIVTLSDSTVAAWATVASDADPLSLLRASAHGMVNVAAGSPHPGLDGFRRSHEEAMAARRVSRLRGGAPPVTLYTDVALIDLATVDLDRSRAFVADELGRLAAEDEQTARLAATLLAYLEHQGSARRAAAGLGIHENTVANRVRTAREMLGRPVDDRVPELLVALRLAPVVRPGSAA